MRSLAFCLVLLVGAQAAEDEAALKTITRAIRDGDQELLAGFHTIAIAIGEDEPAAFGEKTLMEQVAHLTGGPFTRVRDVEDGN